MSMIIDLKTLNKLDAPSEEAYLTLRTNLQFFSAPKEIKLIAVTSCDPNEGKTTTSTYLAISIAKTNKKVLLVDADFRKAMTARCSLALRLEPGLTSYLSGMAEFDDVIKSTSIPNLFFTLRGLKPPNPTELLSSELFKKFIEKAREQFDSIILDTPPLGVMIDSAIIAPQTDGVILVVKANTTDYKKVLKVKEQLEKTNCRILGVVLNKLSKKEYKDYYRYYDYGINHKMKSK